MPCNLMILNNQEILLESGLSNDYVGLVLAGSNATFCKNDLVECVIQKIIGNGYIVQLSVIKFFEKIATTGLSTVPGLYSRFILKNGLRHDIPEIGQVHLREGQFLAIHGTPGSCKIMYETAKDHQVLDIFYSPELIEQLIPFFPQLKSVIKIDKTVLLQQGLYWTMPSMHEIIQQLLTCPYDEDTRIFYFDLKIREMLFLILEKSYKHDNKYKFTPWETARIHKAKEILQEYISKKPLSTRMLSRKVAINEFKLKTGFRQTFNIGIFEWLMEAKMQKAKELLLSTNKPIKEICELVGYPRTTNFITAFRRRFGQTPGSIRRN